MKLYLDKNKRIIAHELVFFDPKDPEGRRPETHVDTGQEQDIVFLTPEQNQFIVKYAQKGGKVTDLIFDGEFTEDKQPIPVPVCGYDMHQTVLVQTSNFTPDSDLKRHITGVEKYEFRQLSTIPLDQIKEQYLYDSDKNILQKEATGRLPVGRDKKYFGLFDKDRLVAFVFLLTMSIAPKIAVLYHDEAYNNGGYWIMHALIQFLAKENIKALDLGGLTKEDSGINQFKKKWGAVVATKDLYKR